MKFWLRLMSLFQPIDQMGNLNLFLRVIFNALKVKVMDIGVYIYIHFELVFNFYS